MFRSLSLQQVRNDLLERVFLFLRRFKPTRERVTIGEYNDHVEREHVARYQFALRFCEGKTVADIACGTGYGSQILRKVAKNVVGFDKENLCGNRLIDLEKDSWPGTYDVIVSFETIEHLSNPDFFLENAQRATTVLIVSTPVGEFRGYNPHHKQVWTFPEFKAVVERYFRCEYYFQKETEISSEAPSPVRFVIAVGTPKLDARQL
jgi:2-polyprenyl-3-methyl-5-hydroxy-6-metoxy-1,4-benzoquinol methylase